MASKMLAMLERGGRLPAADANHLLGGGRLYHALKRGWIRRQRVDARRVDYVITARGKRYVMDTLLEEVERALD